MTRRLRTWLPVVLSAAFAVSCANCQDTTPQRATERAASPATAPTNAISQEQLAELLPPPSGTPLPPATFVPLVPDNVAGFSADGPAEPRSVPLANGGEMTAVRRTYKRGDESLRVEVSDALHAPLLGKLVLDKQGTKQANDRSLFAGKAIDGQPAIVQWQAANQTALANVLIAGRLLLNVQVTPAKSAKVAVDVAHGLPLSQLAALVPMADPEGSKAGATPSGAPTPP